MVLHPTGAPARSSTGMPFLALAVAACIASTNPASAAAAPQDCSRDSIGQLGIDELMDSGSYLGFEGGLYPGRTNECPTDHLNAGRQIAKTIVPLLPDGTPGSPGLIGVICIGSSFTRTIFDSMIDHARGDADFPPELKFVNCADGKQNLDVIADPNAPYWSVTVPYRLAHSPLTAAQVQVVWINGGVQEQTEPFPDHFRTTAEYWIDILQICKATFPNLKQAYLSPVHYLGYTVSAPADEPYYFEQGFAVREVVERQMAQDPELEFDASRGPALAPWVAWGPYLWCDGSEPRVDGLQMLCTDYWPDGAHPNVVGSARLGWLLYHHWKSHRACTRWSVVKGAAPAERMAAVERFGSGTGGQNGTPRLCASALPTIPYAGNFAFLMRDAKSGGMGFVLLGETEYPGGFDYAGGRVYLVPTESLPIQFDPSGNGSVGVGSIPDDPALWGVTVFAQAVVFDTAGPDGQHSLTEPIELRLGD